MSGSGTASGWCFATVPPRCLPRRFWIFGPRLRDVYPPILIWLCRTTPFGQGLEEILLPLDLVHADPAVLISDDLSCGLDDKGIIVIVVERFERDLLDGVESLVVFMKFNHWGRRARNEGMRRRIKLLRVRGSRRGRCRGSWGRCCTRR